MARVYLDNNDNFIYEDIDLTPLIGHYRARTGYSGSYDFQYYIPMYCIHANTDYDYNIVNVIDGVDVIDHGDTTTSLAYCQNNGITPGPLTLRYEGIPDPDTGEKGKFKCALFMCIVGSGNRYQVCYAFVGRRTQKNPVSGDGINAAVCTGGGLIYGSDDAWKRNAWYASASSSGSNLYTLQYSYYGAEVYTSYQAAVDAINAIEPAFPTWKNVEDTDTLARLQLENSSEGLALIAWIKGDEGWNMDTNWNKPKSILNCINAYIMTDTRLDRLQNSLWYTDGTSQTKFSNGLYANPMECILGLNFIPFDPAGNIGSLDDVVVGLQKLHYYSGGSAVNLDATKLSNEYKEFDFGTKSIPRLFNDYRDYTEIQTEIYLPCIGWHNLNSEEVVGQNLNIKYRLNFVTGDILAVMSIGDNIIDSVPGNCLQSIPFSGRDMTNLIGAQRQANGNLLSMGAGVLSTAAGIGMAAAGNPLGLGMAAGGVGTIINGMNNAANASNEVSKAQNQVVKSGSIGGSTGILGYNIPYIVMKSHTDAMPVGYEEYIGESTHKIMQIGLLTGYVKTDSYRANFTDATDEEKAEINALMDGGVIV